MRIGIYGGNVRRGAGIESVVEDAERAEDAGFVSYWFPQVGSYDALTAIALAGQRTSSIEFGTAVVPSYPRHPNGLAQQAATVNLPGRGDEGTDVKARAQRGEAIHSNLGEAY